MHLVFLIFASLSLLLYALAFTLARLTPEAMESPQQRPRKRHIPPGSWLDPADDELPQFREPPPRFPGEPAVQRRRNPLSAIGEERRLGFTNRVVVREMATTFSRNTQGPPSMQSTKQLSLQKTPPSSAASLTPQEVLSSRIAQARQRIHTGNPAARDRALSRSLTPHRPVGYRPLVGGGPGPAAIGGGTAGSKKREREGEQERGSGRKKFTAKRRKIVNDGASSFVSSPFPHRFC